MSELWPHQSEAILQTLSAISGGQRRICITSPTGMGKSRIMWELLKRWLAEEKRCILYTNRKMLIEQTSDVLNNAGIRHGVRAAGYLDQRERRLQISSVQTEASRVLKKKKWDLHRADYVFIDEAHLNKAGTAKQLIDMHVASGAVAIGVTATPVDVGDIYDHLIVAGTTSDGRHCGALVPAVHYGCDEPDLRKIDIQEGKDLTEKQQVKAMRRPGLFGRIWEWFCKINPDKRPSICFGPDVEGSVWIAEQFLKKGVRSAHIDGEDVWIDGNFYRSSPSLRQDILEESKDGRITVLCNRFVLREGVDLPWLSHAIFACIFGSVVTYLQAGGRLLRSHPSIQNVTIQDHGGNYWRHLSLNLDRTWDLTLPGCVAAGQFVESQRNLPPERQPFLCPSCRRVWKSGTVCEPAHGGCGYVIKGGKRSRPVVTESGELIEMPGGFYKSKKPYKGQDGPSKWKQMYWRARSDKWDATFRQAESMFAYENWGQWPDRHWPYMPKRYIDLWRKVKLVRQEDIIP